MTIKLDDVDRLAHEIGNYTGTVEQMVARRRGALRTVQDRALEVAANEVACRWSGNSLCQSSKAASAILALKNDPEPEQEAPKMTDKPRLELEDVAATLSAVLRSGAGLSEEEEDAADRSTLEALQGRTVEAVAAFLRQAGYHGTTSRLIYGALAAARKPVQEKCCPDCTCFCRRKPDVKLLRERLEAARLRLEQASDELDALEPESDD